MMKTEKYADFTVAIEEFMVPFANPPGKFREISRVNFRVHLDLQLRILDAQILRNVRKQVRASAHTCARMRQVDARLEEVRKLFNPKTPKPQTGNYCSIIRGTGVFRNFHSNAQADFKTLWSLCLEFPAASDGVFKFSIS